MGSQEIFIAILIVLLQSSHSNRSDFFWRYTKADDVSFLETSKSEWFPIVTTACTALLDLLAFSHPISYHFFQHSLCSKDISQFQPAKYDLPRDLHTHCNVLPTACMASFLCTPAHVTLAECLALAALSKLAPSPHPSLFPLAGLFFNTIYLHLILYIFICLLSVDPHRLYAPWTYPCILSTSKSAWQLNVVQ